MVLIWSLLGSANTTNVMVYCESDPLQGSLSSLESVRSISENYVDCSAPSSENELCTCKTIFPSDSEESKSIVETESEKVLVDAFQGELWSLAQSMINLDAISKKKKGAVPEISSSCNVSAIFEKVSSFGNDPSCNGENFKKRVNSIFGTESLAEAQQKMVDQIKSITENKAPLSLQSNENVCLPYTTYNYMKNLDYSSGEEKLKGSFLLNTKVINERCDNMVSDKMKGIFCSEKLPNLNFNEFKENIGPRLRGSSSRVAYSFYCQQSNPREGQSGDEVTLAQVEQDFFDLSKREETDLEKLNSGELTGFETFNKNICGLLPECQGNETNSKCRDVINLRRILLDNLGEKLRSSGTEEAEVKKLLEKFANNPESISYDSETFKGLSDKEVEASSELLDYLNNFILTKSEDLVLADGTKFIKRHKSSSSSKEGKPLKGERVKDKKEKLLSLEDKKKLLLNKLANNEVSISSTSGKLDEIETPKLLDKFAKGAIVRDPTVNSEQSSGPSISSPQASVASTGVSSNGSTNAQETQSSLGSSETSSATEASPSSNLSNFKSPGVRKIGRGKPFDRASRSAFKANPSSGSSGSTRESTGRVGDNFELPERASSGKGYTSSGNRSVAGNSSMQRYSDAYEKYSAPSSGGSSRSGGEEIASAAEQGAGEFEDIKTGKAGSGGIGSSKKGNKKDSDGSSTEAGAAAGKGFRLDKNGKRIPLYMFDKTIPYLLIEKNGVSQTVIDFDLVGKRFNSLEITSEGKFVLHTYDFVTPGLEFEENLEDDKYNSVRLDVLEQIKEVQNAGEEVERTMKMLSKKTKKVLSKEVIYEIKRQEIMTTLIPIGEFNKKMAKTK